MEEYRKRLEENATRILASMLDGFDFETMSVPMYEKILDSFPRLAVKFAKKVIKEVDADIESSKQNV